MKRKPPVKAHSFPVRELNYSQSNSFFLPAKPSHEVISICLDESNDIEIIELEEEPVPYKKPRLI